MKSLNLLLVFFIFTFSYSQNVLFNFSKKEFIKSEIEFKSGTKIKGFVKDFNAPNTVEFRNFDFNFKSIESKLKLDRETIIFKESKDSKSRKIGTDSIKSVVLFEDDDTIKYEKIKLKTINSSLKLIDLEREIMVPLIREDKINLYGLVVFNCDGLCELMYMLTYIKKPNDEFAISPVDVNRLNFFNLFTVEDRFFKAFEITGGDCKAFTSFLKDYKELGKNKEAKKEARDDFKQYRKENKMGSYTRKELKSATEAYGKLFLKNYHILIDNYAKRCD